MAKIRITDLRPAYKDHVQPPVFHIRSCRFRVHDPAASGYGDMDSRLDPDRIVQVELFGRIHGRHLIAEGRRHLVASGDIDKIHPFFLRHVDERDGVLQSVSPFYVIVLGHHPQCSRETLPAHWNG